ncbi:MAG: hypothetical protein II891_03890 [Bacteroidales bacterium]|nr:hypothetical protein [Bacteroidales bacterium]
MKKILMICAAGLAVLAAVSCCKNANKVTAIVAGPEQDVIALQIAYEAPVCPESVCPEAFEVCGREVVCAKACPKSGAVTLILKGNCPKAECAEKAECGEKPECEKACDKPCEKKCEEPKPCCKEEKACCEEDCCAEPKPCKEEGAECCDKPECCKKGDKPCCKEGKPECEKKAECGDKPECKKECKEIAVPKICVKQVADIKDVEGNVIPAWKKAVKASEVKPFCAKKAKCGEKPECSEKPECEKACEKECE